MLKFKFHLEIWRTPYVERIEDDMMDMKEFLLVWGDSYPLLTLFAYAKDGIWEFWLNFVYVEEGKRN